MWRHVIVDTVDELNPNAANALLKSLEEPPSRTVFLLLTAEPGRLLPTIRSRCRLLELSPLSAPDLRQAATAALAAADAPQPEASISDRLISLAAGSVRRLLVLSHGDGLKLYERIERILAALPNVDWSAAHTLADELAVPASEQRFEIFFDLLLTALARAIRAGATGEGAQGDLAQIVRETGPARWAELWENIVAEKADVDVLNLDRRAFILGILSRLAAAAQAQPR